MTKSASNCGCQCCDHFPKLERPKVYEVELYKLRAKLDIAVKAIHDVGYGHNSGQTSSVYELRNICRLAYEAIGCPKVIPTRTEK